MHMLNKYISVKVTAKLVSCSNPSCSLRAATSGFARGLKKSNILGCNLKGLLLSASELPGAERRSARALDQAVRMPCLYIFPKWGNIKWHWNDCLDKKKVGKTTLLLYKNKTKAQDWRLKIEGSRKVTPPQIFHNFNWTHYLKQKFRIEGSKKVSLTTNRGSKSTCLLTFSDQPLKSQQKN